MGDQTRPCSVPWCDQGERPHSRHEATLGTWSGSAFSGERRVMTVQVVVHGYGDDDVEPMVSIVDSASLGQVDSVLTWDDALSLGNALVAAATRLGPATSAQ